MATESLLGGDITVYFPGDAAGDKQIKWTGSTATTATRTVNELYTARSKISLIITPVELL